MSENKFSGPEALARCVPMSRLQSVLSGKWKILILWYVAFYRVQRFGQLLRRLDGITQSTLTKQLRELEADGFLRREVFPEVPPRVEYTLTELGEGFLPVLEAMLRWSEENLCSPGYVSPYSEGLDLRGPKDGEAPAAHPLRKEGRDISDVPPFGFYSGIPSPKRPASLCRCSMGNGGAAMGRAAMDSSFMGLSSAATRLDDRAPHRLQRWMTAHSPPFRTQTATGSISPPQSAARSPGSTSRWRLVRQLGQWLRWPLPAPSGPTGQPQALQVKASPQGWVL